MYIGYNIFLDISLFDDFQPLPLITILHILSIIGLPRFQIYKATFAGGGATEREGGVPGVGVAQPHRQGPQPGPRRRLRHHPGLRKQKGIR